MAEGRALREAVQKYGVVFQWGTQQRSSVNYRLTAELVRNGYIGDVRNIMIGSAGGSPPKPEPPETLKDPPAGFDYNQWLGPSPYVPYSDVRVSLTWLFIRDYGLGCLGGAWGIHDLDAAQILRHRRHQRSRGNRRTRALFRGHPRRAVPRGPSDRNTRAGPRP